MTIGHLIMHVDGWVVHLTTRTWRAAKHAVVVITQPILEWSWLMACTKSPETMVEL
jgi:hypothetical protein